jgi:hypothetical protein
VLITGNGEVEEPHHGARRKDGAHPAPTSNSDGAGDNPRAVWSRLLFLGSGGALGDDSEDLDNGQPSFPRRRRGPSRFTPSLRCDDDGDGIHQALGLGFNAGVPEAHDLYPRARGRLRPQLPGRFARSHCNDSAGWGGRV